MTNGRASGFDGILVEFYKAFWSNLGEGILSLMAVCIKVDLASGELTSLCYQKSMRNYPMCVGTQWCFSRHDLQGK